jgi:hypothetical protein
LVKLNEFWLGSVASIFISFSAVTMSNSRLAMVVYADSPSLPELMAVPKYRPLCSAAAPRVAAAAAAMPEMATAAVNAVAPTAATSIVVRPHLLAERRVKC